MAAGMTFAEKIILFCRDLDFKGELPEGISIMNPYKDSPLVMSLVSDFYKKFYSDNNMRHMILGINPGRFGAGITGIPFTDTHRLKNFCGLSYNGPDTFETSSVFVYEMISEYGGVESFYSDFFISAVSPLGFTSLNARGKEVNYNYYDSKKLKETVSDFILSSLRRQLDFGIKTDKCFCLGSGKNFKFLSDINADFHFFGSIVPLEHPRFIMQYRTKRKKEFIRKYITELGKIR